MTATLFLTDTLTALKAGEGSFETRETVFGRRGKLKSGAAEVLSSFGEGGEVVACLPPGWTSCQTLRVRANIGRQVQHTDLSDALEAALKRAGGPDQAVVSAEPSRIMLDGEEVPGSPVGKQGQTLEVDVAALLCPLARLAELEKVLEKAGFALQGVMAIEEAAAAAISPGKERKPGLVLVDRWHTKIVSFVGDTLGVSSVIPVGSGHLMADLAVTFTIPDDRADVLVDKILLARTGSDDADKALVVDARLEEIASRAAEAARKAGIADGTGVLLGLPVTSKVQKIFAAHGLDLRSPRLELAKTDPPLLAIADGAAMLAAGAVPRSAVTALQLSAPKSDGTIWNWLRRNF